MSKINIQIKKFGLGAHVDGETLHQEKQAMIDDSFSEVTAHLDAIANDLL